MIHCVAWSQGYLRNFDLTRDELESNVFRVYMMYVKCMGHTGIKQVHDQGSHVLIFCESLKCSDLFETACLNIWYIVLVEKLIVEFLWFIDLMWKMFEMARNAHVSNIYDGRVHHPCDGSLWDHVSFVYFVNLLNYDRLIDLIRNMIFV